MFNMYFEAVCEEKGLEYQKCAEYDNRSLYVIQGKGTWELICKYNSICSEFVDNCFSAPDECFSFLGEDLCYDLGLSDLWEDHDYEMRIMAMESLYNMIRLQCVIGVNKWGLSETIIYVVGEKDYLKLIEYWGMLKDDVKAEMEEMEE